MGNYIKILEFGIHCCQGWLETIFMILLLALCNYSIREPAIFPYEITGCKLGLAAF
jgi:hypothetical protein